LLNESAKRPNIAGLKNFFSKDPFTWFSKLRGNISLYKSESYRDIGD
jgi:hypothetical protein